MFSCFGTIRWCDRRTDVQPIAKTCFSIADARKKKEKTEKKARKVACSGKLGVRPDHPRWRSDMWSCMPGGLREVVLSFKFRQNRLNGFRDVGVENCHFLYFRPVAYITACTTVQAVIYSPIQLEWQVTLTAFSCSAISAVSSTALLAHLLNWTPCCCCL